MGGLIKKLAIVLVLVGVAAGVGLWFWMANGSTQDNFRTKAVVRGPLIATVGATGTLQPQELVDVGAQVAGPIIALGKDPKTVSRNIDWGSAVEGSTIDVDLLNRVTAARLPFTSAMLLPILDRDGTMIKKGTVLAQIDDRLYKAQVASAEASVKQVEADRILKLAQLYQATKDWKRAQGLKKSGGLSQAEYDQFEANFKVTTANLGVNDAQRKVALGNLIVAETNLNYTTIRSPVKGVIIDRRVNVGQTVVASLSAPSLFLIAKDLTKMEVWATVNEVDIGKIKVGQSVNFTVDAFPGRTFPGKVIPQGIYASRLNASMNQNVVTYTVVVTADNKDNTLKPYLTANLSFIVADRKNALLVPNAALRWVPAPNQIAPDARAAYFKTKTKKRSAADADVQDRGIVWVKDDEGFVRPIQVRLGPSDTVNTEVLSVIRGGELNEGTEVVIGEGHAQSNNGGGNPFTPQIFKKKQQQPGA